jgi:hypothetical protein
MLTTPLSWVVLWNRSIVNPVGKLCHSKKPSHLTEWVGNKVVECPFESFGEFHGLSVILDFGLTDSEDPEPLFLFADRELGPCFLSDRPCLALN